MRVVDVRTHVLLDPGFDLEATSSAQDTIVVEVVTDEGIVGIGEADLNAWIARACIEAPGMHTMDRGLKQMLIGQDPLDPARIWNELYIGSAMSGRRGAVVHALGADGRHQAEIGRLEIFAVGIAARHERVVTAAEEARVGAAR